MADLNVWTIGYEGRNVRDLIDALVAAGIEVLVDVRQRASSRKPGLSKTALSKELKQSQIQYVHMPVLGTPSALRKRLKAAEIQLAEYLGEYRQYLHDQGDEFEKLTKYVTDAPCCLLCYEANPEECHRNVLADLIVEGIPAHGKRTCSVNSCTRLSASEKNQ